jgi:hypothetical protein
MHRSCGINDWPSRFNGGLVVRGYNTSKVVIGCRYEPPKRSHMDDTNIWWQTILLGRKESLWERLIKELTK